MSRTKESGPYDVKVTDRALKELNKLSKEQKRKVEGIVEQLKINPYVGDQIRYKFFREKRLDGDRLYWLIYERKVIVLIVGVSDKKTQQDFIDYVLNNPGEFEKLI